MNYFPGLELGYPLLRRDNLTARWIYARDANQVVLGNAGLPQGPFERLKAMFVPTDSPGKKRLAWNHTFAPYNRLG